MKTWSHSIVNNNIFWKRITRRFRCIYVNCFNILRLFCWGQHKIEKMHFFDNFRVITQEGNMKTAQMTPFFFIYFFYLLVRFISEFENTWNSFSNSLLWSILVCKIPQFLLKLLICQLIKLFQKVEIPWGYQKSILCFVYLLEENTYFFRIQLMDYMGGGWRKFHTELFSFCITFLMTKKIAFKSPFDLYFHLLIEFFWFV